ncbi:MAG: hypothetical protein L0Z62_48015 [Gemmataceae bacterium]|nr:hypothetical protein [Gemmataceae bacterium]
MPFLTHCPHCQRPLRVPEHGVGKTVRCPACSTPFVAQAPLPTVQPVGPAEPPTVAPIPPPPSLSVPAGQARQARAATAHDPRAVSGLPPPLPAGPGVPSLTRSASGGFGQRPAARSTGRSPWPWVISGVAALLLIGAGVVTWLLLRGGSQAAAVPDDAWQLFAHAEGRFEVLMPGQPREQVQMVAIPDGHMAGPTFMVELNGGMLAYGATFQDIPGHIAVQLPPERRLDNSREGALISANGRLRKETRIDYHGHPGREWEIEIPENNLVIVQRTYLIRLGNRWRLYSINATAPGGPAPADLQKFFGSFRITGLPDRTLSLDAGPNFHSWFLSRDAKRVLALDHAGTLQVWATDGGAPGARLQPAQGRPLERVALGPDGRTAAASGSLGELRVCDLDTGAVTSLRGTDQQGWQRGRGLACSTDGKLLAAAHRLSEIQLWDLPGGKLRHTLQSEGLVRALALSPDSKILASASTRMMQLWDTATGSERAILEWTAQPRDEEMALTFSPDGKSLLLLRQRHRQLWDVATARPRLRQEGTQFLLLAAFSPDGKLLAVPGIDGGVRLWDPATGAHRGVFQPDNLEPGQALSVLGFTPDSGQLVVGHGRALQWWGISRLANAPQVIPVPLAPVNEQPPPGRARHLQGHEADVLALHFSPDGKTLLSASSDRGVRRWDVAAGRLTGSAPGQLFVTEPYFRIAFAPKGDTLLLGREGNELRALAWRQRSDSLWLANDGTRRVSPGVAWSLDGKSVATGHVDGQVRIWDSAARELRAFKAHPAPVMAVAFAPDGKTLASGSSDGTLKLWETATGKELAMLEQVPEGPGHIGGFVWALAFSPDGKTLACAERDYVRLWDVAQREEKASLQTHQAVYSLTFNGKGNLLAGGAADGRVRVWDPVTGSCRGVLSVPPAPARALAFAPADDLLAVGLGREVRVVELESLLKQPGDASQALRLASANLPRPDARGRLVLQGQQREVIGVQFTADSKQVVGVAHDGGVRAWDVASGRSRDSMRGEGFARSYNMASFKPDGSAVMLGTFGGPLRRVDLKARAASAFPEKVKLGPKDSIRSLALAPDGKLLATGHAQPEVRLWDMATEEVRFTLAGHKGPVSALAFAPDGKLLASGSWDGTVKLWDAAEGKEAPPVPQRDGPGKRGRAIESLAFSGDGGLLAASWVDGVVRVFRVPGRELAHELKTATTPKSLALAPDGKRLAVGLADGKVEVWDTVEGKRLAVLDSSARLGVRSLAFSPDGTRLAATGLREVDVWDLAVALKGP